MHDRSLIAVAVCFILSAWATGQTPSVPRFEPGRCPVELPQGETHVECGFLIVPENRQRHDGRTIRLPVGILRSESSGAKGEPLLRMLGGPGASSIRLVRSRRSSAWLRDRDEIVLEQRGTRYADPALECPEIGEATSSSAKAGLDTARTKSNVIAAAARCYKRLTASGIDLDAYNSAESAADIDDLRRVLKVPRLDLYGVSYSSHLMLEVMRRYPETVGAAVLESTLPPEVNYDEVGVDAMVRSLNELFSSCRSDKACAAAYPDLEREFYAVVARLNGQPLIAPAKDPKTGESFPIRLTGDDFATWIVDYLFSNEPSATVDAPMVIHRAFAGDYVPQFRNYAGDKLGTAPYSWGMRYSFWCSEERPFESAAKIRDQSTKFAGLKGYEVMALPDICSVWPVKHAEKVANTGVASRVPTLMIAAEYDSYTDPAWARTVAGRLQNSFFVQIPWAGHGPGFSVPCVATMIADFLDNPAKKPADECVLKTAAAFHFTLPASSH